MSDVLPRLAALIRQRGELDAKIAAITGRSARPGDVGEFVAAEVFGIELAGTANQAGHDGWFRSGPLAGRTVNIKMYGDPGDGIDISPHACDFYLILSGPKRPSGGVRRHNWWISAANLFETRQLLETLADRGVQVGVATSIRQGDLDAARIFPDAGTNPALALTAEQATQLSLFG